MSKLNCSKGVINISDEILYPGVKKIDKSIARDNLKLLKKYFDDNGLKYILAFGTLLGAIRDKDFIDHDEDVDLIVFDKDKEKIYDTLFSIQEIGFSVVRNDRRGLISIMRKGEYIDLYFFSNYKSNLYYCGGILCPCQFLDNLTTIDFLGDEYYAPADYKGFLLYRYGETWETPIEWNNYSMSPIKKILHVIKEKIKICLPDWLFFKITKKTDAKLEKYFQEKVDSYYSYVKSHAL